jgi:exosortase K
MNTRLGAVAAVALIALALKRHYAHASSDALWWMLQPTAQLVGMVTGTAFVAVPGEGYLSAERLFLIEKACAGINFMIAALVMVTFTLLHRVRSVRGVGGVLALSLAASYVAAVVVNSLRISTAMWLAANPLMAASLTAAEVHRLEGIVVYFGGLLLLHELIRRIDRERGGSVRRIALPLGCYYLVTLALPLTHGGVRANPVFLTHALTVLVLPPLLLVFVSGIRRTTYSLARTVRKV